MKIDTKNILIGAGVVVVGYLLWKKSQKDEVNKRVQNLTKNDEIQTDKFGQPRVKPTMGLAMPIVELDWSILSKIPNEFIVKSNGYNTRYYKNQDKTLTGFSSTFAIPELYTQSFRTDGSIGGVQPQKISTREFSDAYSVFLKQPK
jgi:hypothetical protein